MDPAAAVTTRSPSTIKPFALANPDSVYGPPASGCHGVAAAAPLGDVRRPELAQPGRRRDGLQQVRPHAGPEHRVGTGEQLDDRAGEHLEADQRRARVAGQADHRHPGRRRRSCRSPSDAARVQRHLGEARRPSRERIRRTMSPGPVPVPPVVMIRSARSVWSSSRPRRPSGSSSQMPMRYACAPASAAAAVRRVRVRVDDLAGLAGAADLDELVAGGEQHHARAGPHHEVPDAGRGEHRDQGGRDVRAGAARAARPPGSSSPARRRPLPRLPAR